MPTPTATPIPQLAPVFDAVRQFLVLVRTGERAGTGLVIGDGSYILTTNAVLDNTSAGGSYALATVHHDDGSLAAGIVIGQDPDRDLAVLSLVGGGTHFPLSLGFQGIPGLAETVAIIGYSQGVAGFPSAHLGVVNVRADTGNTGVRYLETDALVGPGSGGSPVVSLQGEPMGIIVNSTPLLMGELLPGHAYALTMDDVRLAVEEMGVPLG